MPRTPCDACGRTYVWQWEDAFNKFGFDDGGDEIMTPNVCEVLERFGYTTQHEPWGIHNITITSIKMNGTELMSYNAMLGYDCPRKYLPKTLVELLDRELGDDVEVTL